MSPWGSGPEPADHEFMQRLFRRWDVDVADSLSLQNVVTGFAHVKGTKDIMSNIAYFFELYDDDGDGRVDREGILRISEALLFLSRRGFSNSSSPTTSISDLRNGSPERGNRDEQFLSSVSAFIRRCFEYADPDHQNSQGNQSLNETKNDLDNFAIGTDDEDDLMDFGSEPSTPIFKKSSASTFSQATTESNPLSPTNNLTPIETNTSTDSSEAERAEKARAANLALDPNKPLHITLPTFRMVILADEVLEQFFEVGFSSSFRLADAPLTSHGSSSSNLTTFANAGKQLSGAASGLGGVVGGAGAGIVPPGKGLRGVLDNIVSDGMRVAAEVRRRMDEAQKDMDREAKHGRDDEDEEEEPSNAKDLDLLDGAETAGVDTTKESTVIPDLLTPTSPEEIKPGRKRTGSDASRRVLEFEA
jgi:hypothetical protein